VSRLLELLRRYLPRRDGSEGQGFLAKWALLGTLIGAVAGLGSALFFYALETATDLFLGRLAGYQPPLPLGEGGTGAAPGAAVPWLVPLVMAGGGVLSGLIVARLAPEAEGHGTDAAIRAVHRDAGRVRRRIPLVKLVASAITIGSGGSGGREGPSAQISAGFGSALADWLRLSAQDRRIAVAAGMGAGIGAIFRAPLGGALMAAEILYLHDLETDAIIPGLIASIVGYSVFGAIYGFEPIFGAQPQIALDSPLQLPYYALLGLACGLVGIVYAETFYGVSAAFRRLRWPAWLKPALGGLAVGLLGLALPQVLHTGYGWVQLGMSTAVLELPLAVVLVVPFAKILATALSIGSGGSGGIFGPGMVIGGLLGAALWRLGHGVLPHLPDQPAPFVIVGMMALFGGIAHAPLAMMLMVAEMTGNLSLLAPAMIAVALATALVGERTIYRAQLPNRAASPAHRVRMAFPLLSSLSVRDAMRSADVVAEDASLDEARAALGTDGAVVLRDGRPVGVLTSASLADAPGGARAGDAMRPCAPLAADLPLDEALQALDDAGLGWLPVVDDGRLVGRVGTRGIIRTYKETLGRGVRRVSALPPETALLEATVSAASPVAGRSLAEARLPAATLVVSLVRDGAVTYPRGDTVVAAGDRLTVLTAAGAEDEVKRYLVGE
jgi:CIC family chloride channel protein